jgi:hypothetical protein
MTRGECLACAKLGACRETNEERILQSYTCTLFEGVPEPVYLARLTTMTKYGEHMAIRAMLAATHEEGEEENG